jgi:hypothetical protein
MANMSQFGLADDADGADAPLPACSGQRKMAAVVSTAFGTCGTGEGEGCRVFDTWAELGRTYQFVQQYRPDLLQKTFAEALNVALAPHGTNQYSNNTGFDNIKSSPSYEGGTSAAYLTARIGRDRPDILARMKAGDYKSVRAAAKEAGIVKDPTPLQQRY